MAKPITNRVKNSKTPVIRKDLDGGVIAEANNDGSIYVDKDVKPGSPLEKEAIAHEKVHLNQMKRGDLNYDDNNVYWKGKAYPRSSMNEGAKNLPWEKEAYDKTKHMNTETSKNKARPITAKAKMSSSPLNLTTEEIRGALAGTNKVGTFKTKAAESMRKLNEAAKEGVGTYDGPYDPNVYKSLQKELDSGFALKKYGFSGSDVKEYEQMKMDLPSFPSNNKTINKTVTDTKSKPTATFTQGNVKVEGDPGEEGAYNMGYYESRNLAGAGRVQERNKARDIRQANRNLKRFERKDKRGRTPIDPRTMEKFKDAKDYAAFKASNVDFENPGSVRSGGKLSTTSGVEKETTSNTKSKNLPTYKIVGGKIVTSISGNNTFNVDKPITKQMIAEGFRMSGYGNKNKKIKQ